MGGSLSISESRVVLTIVDTADGNGMGQQLVMHTCTMRQTHVERMRAPVHSVCYDRREIILKKKEKNCCFALQYMDSVTL